MTRNLKKQKLGVNIIYDYQMPIKTSQLDPNELLSVLNSINKSIQFTLEIDSQTIPFLDILVKNV